MPGRTTVFVSPLDEVSATAKQDLGTLRWEGNKCYKYVQYKATAIACIAGRMTGFFEDSGALNHQVTLDTSDQVQAATLVGSGIAVGIIPTDGYGWVQIKGQATMSVAFAAGADGDPMTLVGATADLGDLDVLVTTAANGHVCAYAGDAATFTVSLDCPF